MMKESSPFQQVATLSFHGYHLSFFFLSNLSVRIFREFMSMDDMLDKEESSGVGCVVWSGKGLTKLREDGIVCVDSYMRNLFTIRHSELRYFFGCAIINDVKFKARTMWGWQKKVRSVEVRLSKDWGSGQSYCRMPKSSKMVKWKERPSRC